MYRERDKDINKVVIPNSLFEYLMEPNNLVFLNMLNLKMPEVLLQFISVTYYARTAQAGFYDTTHFLSPAPGVLWVTSKGVIRF